MKLWDWTKGMSEEDLDRWGYGFRALRPEPVAECLFLGMLISTAILMALGLG